MPSMVTHASPKPQLAATYSYLLTQIDTMVAEAACQNSDLGKLVRTAIGKLSPGESASVKVSRSGAG